MLDKYSSPNSIMSDSHCGRRLNVFVSVSKKKVLQIESACQLDIEFLRVILQLKKAEKKLARNIDTKNSSCSFRYWS
jgi:hypothetical protein